MKLPKRHTAELVHFTLNIKLLMQLDELSPEVISKCNFYKCCILLFNFIQPEYGLYLAKICRYINCINKYIVLLDCKLLPLWILGTTG